MLQNMLNSPVQRGKMKRVLYCSKSGTLENIQSSRLVIRYQERMAFHLGSFTVIVVVRERAENDNFFRARATV